MPGSVRGESTVLDALEDEASVTLQLREKKFPELEKPIDVLFLGVIPVLLLPLQCERRASHDEIHAVVW